MKTPFAGFTLVETMVAIAILLVTIAAPLLTAERAAAAAYAGRDQLTASYLAEEALEYVRAMRDDTYLSDYQTQSANPNLSTIAWNDFLTGALTSSITNCIGKTCELDPTKSMGVGPLSAVSVCSGSCTPLSLTPSGIYTEQSSPSYTQTKFTRSFTLSSDTSLTDPDGNPLGEGVSVTVSWQTDGIPNSITIKDNLTPWQ